MITYYTPRTGCPTVPQTTPKTRGAPRAPRCPNSTWGSNNRRQNPQHIEHTFPCPTHTPGAPKHHPRNSLQFQQCPTAPRCPLLRRGGPTPAHTPPRRK